jgi:hypothetical protein
MTTPTASTTPGDSIAARFARDTAEHQMTVLHTGEA